jgi:hypothetical protein
MLKVLGERFGEPRETRGYKKVLPDSYSFARAAALRLQVSELGEFFGIAGPVG